MADTGNYSYMEDVLLIKFWGTKIFLRQAITKMYLIKDETKLLFFLLKWRFMTLYLDEKHF